MQVEEKGEEMEEGRGGVTISKRRESGRHTMERVSLSSIQFRVIAAECGGSIHSIQRLSQLAVMVYNDTRDSRQGLECNTITTSVPHFIHCFSEMRVHCCRNHFHGDCCRREDEACSPLLVCADGTESLTAAS